MFRGLKNGTKISDVKFVRCYLELFLGGGNYEENQVSGICFRIPNVSREQDER
jgi:hypothetical protein